MVPQVSSRCAREGKEHYCQPRRRVERPHRTSQLVSRSLIQETVQRVHILQEQHLLLTLLRVSMQTVMATNHLLRHPLSILGKTVQTPAQDHR